jgi:hypothetical protein
MNYNGGPRRRNSAARYFETVGDFDVRDLLAKGETVDPKVEGKEAFGRGGEVG